MIDFAREIEPVAVAEEGFPVPFGVLTYGERQRRERCEATIGRQFQSFTEVGDALAEIREHRLYRETHDAFEVYCRERWEMTHRRANQLILAAEIVSNLGTIVPKPSSESVVRPLSSLNPVQQQEAWQRAVESSPNGKPTAAHVASIACEYRQPSEDDHAPAGWSLDDAVEHLRSKLYEFSQRWPQEHLKVMGHQLRDLAEELIETGELPH